VPGIVTSSAGHEIGDNDDVEALRAQIAELRRERARTASQLRKTLQKCEEDSARMEHAEALLAEVEQQAVTWDLVVKQLEPQVEAAIEELRAELSALDHPKGNGSPEESSYEAEKELRLAAEARCLELEAALRTASTEAQLLSKGHSITSLLDNSVSAGQCYPNLAHAAAQRQLCEQQRLHAEEMRDLVGALSQQMQEKDIELEQELDAFLGSGLSRLVDALRGEGLIRGKPKPLTRDPLRAARLRAQLLPQMI